MVGEKVKGRTEVKVVVERKENELTKLQSYSSSFLTNYLYCVTRGYYSMWGKHDTTEISKTI